MFASHWSRHGNLTSQWFTLIFLLDWNLPLKTSVIKVFISSKDVSSYSPNITRVTMFVVFLPNAISWKNDVIWSALAKPSYPQLLVPPMFFQKTFLLKLKHKTLFLIPKPPQLTTMHHWALAPKEDYWGPPLPTALFNPSHSTRVLLPLSFSNALFHILLMSPKRRILIIVVKVFFQLVIFLRNFFPLTLID